MHVFAGFVLFEDILESYYTLYASADDHAPEQRVILATPGAEIMTVFLERTAVKYR